MNKKQIILIIVVMLVVVIACGATYYFLTKDATKTNSTKEPQPVVEQISTDALYTKENYPKIDASTATQPLAMAFANNFTQTTMDKNAMNFTKTHQAYEKLIDGKVDLIIVTQPSIDEQNLAKQKGIELEVIPVVREGFVFFVNTKNEINNLTVEQVQKIYTGDITNWSQVGGKNQEITAYQRPPNSGSQTGMLSLVMKGKPLATPPKENIIDTMAAIINMVSMYNNDSAAIGYSYYYYATTMYNDIDKDIANSIKLLSIDGVKPNEESIKSGNYPFTTSYYMVINKAADENSPARKLANEMLSPRGQKVAKEAGYVPVK